MDLRKERLEAFAAALKSAYTVDELEEMLAYKLDLDLEDIAGPGNRKRVIFQLVTWSRRNGYLLRLLKAARVATPDNGQLREFEVSLGVAGPEADTFAALEGIVNPRSRFNNAQAFYQRLGHVLDTVCAVESPRASGTGFLVAPDMILTNYHVMEPLFKREIERAGVSVRFDFRDLGHGAGGQPGRDVGLSEDWHVASRPYSSFDQTLDAPPPRPDQLDYALVRLAEPVGRQPVRVTETQPATDRGWLGLPECVPKVVSNDPLFIFQHPQEPDSHRLQPIQVAIGAVTGYAGNDLRLRHNVSTLRGSSGSPCLNADLTPVALHHAGEPGHSSVQWGAYNQAIPLKFIVADLDSQGYGDAIERAASMQHGCGHA